MRPEHGVPTPAAGAPCRREAPCASEQLKTRTIVEAAPTQPMLSKSSARPKPHETHPTHIARTTRRNRVRHNARMNPTADFIVHSDWLFSAELGAEVVEDSAIAVRDQRIVALGTRSELEAEWKSKTRIDLPGHLLLPGLVNAHTHSPMTLMRGIGNDTPLHDWLYKLIFPLEAKWVSSEYVHDGTRLAVAEMIRAGITCFADHYYFPETIAETARAMGVRAQVAIPIVEQANNWSANSDEALRRGSELHDRWRDDEFIVIAHGPHAPYTVEIDTFKKILAISEEIESPIHIHLHETEQEVRDFRLRHGASPIHCFHDLGLLTPRLQAVHMTAVDDRDLELIQRCNVGVVHCPQSNALIASGTSPLARLSAAGVRVALGTDGAATNNSLDLFQEMRAANMLSNAATRQIGSLSPADFIRLGTLNAASVLGREQDIGSLRVGKFADLIAIDMNSPGAQPVHDVLAQTVLTNSASRVSHVWVAGNALLKDGELTGCDEKEVIERAKVWKQRIAEGR